MSQDNVETVGAMFAILNERGAGATSRSRRPPAFLIPVEMTFAQLWSLRDGQAVSLRDYATRAEALTAVGLAE